eukprot:803044-Pelagomonas_calceolata.AAC.3
MQVVDELGQHRAAAAAFSPVAQHLQLQLQYCCLVHVHHLCKNARCASCSCSTATWYTSTTSVKIHDVHCGVMMILMMMVVVVMMRQNRCSSSCNTTA